MPESPEPKQRPHPWKRHITVAESSHAPGTHGPASKPHNTRSRLAGRRAVDYAELHAVSNFSFLEGASHPDELIEQAARQGCAAMGITDRNSLAGIVRAHIAAKQHGIKLCVGCELTLDEASTDQLGEATPGFYTTSPNTRNTNHSINVLVYPTDLAAYGRLCQLLTLGKRRAGKGQCHLTLHDLAEYEQGLLAVAVPPRLVNSDFMERLEGLKRVFNEDRLSLAACVDYGPDDARRLEQLAGLAEHVRVPLLATNHARYHHPSRRPLADVLRCIQRGCTIDQLGLASEPNAERHIKSPVQMAELFTEYPQALRRTMELVDRCWGFNLDQLRYEYPRETTPPGRSPMQHLVALTWAGATRRYGRDIPPHVRQQIEHEFQLIEELHYAPYFLTVHDLVNFARSRGILCQGRGAAANSAVCFCLGITAVDPAHIDLLFERFVSRQRNEPPDIDVDFEHERREEVIQYIYRKYGRDRAALTAEVISYRRRSAVREVGKAMGLSLDAVDRLARNMDWWTDGPIDDKALRELGFNPADPTMRHLCKLVGQILGFPRHLSQHVGGFVITHRPLCQLVPIENAAMDDRTVIEWDKDDIDAMGMLKIDVLGLGMMTCLNRTYRLARDYAAENGTTAAPLNGGEQCLDLASIPADDKSVYDMICRADTIGVFQIESRAQMSMLPRLKPRCYYDLVIEVAIVRPGPIQGDMVHPYLRRRNGEEPVSYPNEQVRRVLGKTLGVCLFQEQAMQMAMVAAGFSPEQADQLRRAIAAWKSRTNVIFEMGDQLIRGMIERGYDKDYAQRLFKQIQGFSEYGFPESHAASFALIVYASAWLKHHHPAAFAAGLINSQPMGFYAPAQIIRDARDHGVTVRPIDINHSDWDCTLEPSEPGPAEDHDKAVPLPADASRDQARPAIRLGMRLIKGLAEQQARQLMERRGQLGRFTRLDQLRSGTGLRAATLKRLAEADAFNSLALDRQQALWAIEAMTDQPMPLFDQAAASSPADDVSDAVAYLPAIPAPRRVVQDYAHTGLSLKDHPLKFMRRKLAAMGAIANEQLADAQRWPQGRIARVAGIVLVRQRPSTASGVVFVTLEDETGIANLILRPPIFQRFRRIARHATIMLAQGRVERQGRVIHILAERLIDLSAEAGRLARMSRDFH